MAESRKMWIKNPDLPEGGYWLEVPEGIGANAVNALYTMPQETFKSDPVAWKRSTFSSVIDPVSLTASPMTSKEQMRGVSAINPVSVKGSESTGQQQAVDTMTKPQGYGNEESYRQRALDAMRRKLEEVPSYQYNTAMPKVPTPAQYDRGIEGRSSNGKGLSSFRTALLNRLGGR